LKKFSRLLVLLLIAVSCNVMFASAQESAASISPGVVPAYGTRELPQKRRQIPVVSFPDPRTFFRGSHASDKSTLWKLHLALQLVKHRELDQRQVRIILDAISLSSPEFFTTTTHGPTKKSKADKDLGSLRRRALGAFTNKQAVELFGNIVDAKDEADILKMYYDLSALPLKKRKASFRNALADDKSDLWRTHLALFLVKRPELNDWQKAIILAAMSLATPEFFAIRSTDSDWKAKVRDPSRYLEAQILNVFSFEDGAKIFATLGEDAELAQSSVSVFLKSINYTPGPYKQWTPNKFDNQEMALDRGTCQCSTDSDWCQMSSSCDGGNCNPTQSGCGTLWSYPCNGGCQ
jgi:hypothetical protein